MAFVEDKVRRALETGTSLSLAELGGASAFADDRHLLADSPLMPELLRIALEAAPPSGACGEIIDAFVLACAGARADPMAIHDVIRLVVGADTLAEPTRDRCFRAFVSRINDRSDEPDARWACLEGALRLAFENPGRASRLAAELIDIDLGDDGEFLRHAATVIGVSWSHWAIPGLLAKLERLAELERPRDEATFELGMAALAAGLNATHGAEVSEHLGRAYGWFVKSIEASEGRLDAEAYRNAIDALFLFEACQPYERIAAKVEELARSTVMNIAWNRDADDPPWLGAKWSEMSQWETLISQLPTTARHLDEDGWYDGAQVLREGILSTYVANRAILRRGRDGGIDELVRPRIEGAFIRNQGFLSILERWLTREAADSEWGPVAAELSDRVHQKRRDGGPGNRPGVATTVF